MNNLFFHGSYLTGLTELQPYAKSHNTIKKPVIYFTPIYSHALFYIWNRPYKWVTFDAGDNGTVNFTEVFENQLTEFYGGVTGCVYECGGNNQDIYKTHINYVYNSEKAVPVIGRHIIGDVYTEIINGEKNGKINIKRYDTLTNEEKHKISSDTVRAIHMQKLLTPADVSADGIKEEIEFIKEKFPLEWEIACRNSRDEIDEMINEWKKSIY